MGSGNLLASRLSLRELAVLGRVDPQLNRGDAGDASEDAQILKENVEPRADTRPKTDIVASGWLQRLYPAFRVALRFAAAPEPSSRPFFAASKNLVIFWPYTFD